MDIKELKRENVRLSIENTTLRTLYNHYKAQCEFYEQESDKFLKEIESLPLPESI